VSLATKIRSFKPLELAALVFFAVTGIILLATLPLTGYPPHVGFLGILSLITAYSLFTKRGWAPWLVAILFITITGFTLVTLASAGFSNLVVGLSMLGYFILTLVFTSYLLLKRKD
jgi:hypothetical protein